MLRLAAKPRNLAANAMTRLTGAQPVFGPHMNTTPAKSLRHYSRIPFDAEVLLHLQDGTISVQLIDIALKGALIRTDMQHVLELQEKCRLELPLLDGGEGVVMAGKIVHLQAQLVGIECEDIDVNSLTQLRRLIELNTGDAELMSRELSHLFEKR